MAVESLYGTMPEEFPEPARPSPGAKRKTLIAIFNNKITGSTTTNYVRARVRGGHFKLELRPAISLMLGRGDSNRKKEGEFRSFRAA